MPKTPSQTRHPALQQAQEAQRKARDAWRDAWIAADNEAVKELPGWDGFNIEQKRALMLLPLYSDYKAVSLVLGMDDEWMSKQCQSNAVFREAARLRKTGMHALARRYHADLQGKALLILDHAVSYTVEDGKVKPVAPWPVAVQAATAILKSGILKDEQASAGGNLSFTQINIGGKPLNKPETIMAEAPLPALQEAFQGEPGP